VQVNAGNGSGRCRPPHENQGRANTRGRPSADVGSLKETKRCPEGSCPEKAGGYGSNASHSQCLYLSHIVHVVSVVFPASVAQGFCFRAGCQSRNVVLCSFAPWWHPMLFLCSLAFRDRAFQCCRRGDGHAGWGGLPNEFNLRRGQAVGLIDEVVERALQAQGFDG